jgi:hypothetical protein
MAETEAAERPSGEMPASDQDDKKSIWKVAITPVVLAVLGLVLLPVALALYPSSTATSAPAYSRLSVLTNQRIVDVDYVAIQVKPTLAKIIVSVVRQLPAKPIVGAPAPYLTLVVSPPVGTSFGSCYGGCAKVHGPIPAFTWTVHLPFNGAYAAEAFFVKAKSLGVSDNGENALVAIPEFFYTGVGSPEFLAGYDIPSAGSYDWSALPPAAFKGSAVGWTEPIIYYDTPAKIAVGINQSRQSSDNHLAFLAGALLGVAGGAIIGAVQELLSSLVKSRD